MLSAKEPHYVYVTSDRDTRLSYSQAPLPQIAQIKVQTSVQIFPAMFVAHLFFYSVGQVGKTECENQALFNT